MALVWKKRVTDLLSLRQSSALMLPTGCAQTQGMPYRLPEILLRKLTSWGVRGKRFLIQTQQARKLSSLIGSFDPDCLQSLGHNQCFWTLHPALRPAVSQESVASVRAGTHHSALYLLNQRLLSTLMWYWFGLLISKPCRMCWDFQPFWENNFGNNLRTPESAAKPFWIGGMSICLGSFEFCEIVVLLARMKLFDLWMQHCLTPKWHSSIVIFNPAWRMHLKTARKFWVRYVAILAAIPTSSTYWAHWSKNSRMKLRKADANLLIPCASLL